MPRTITMSLGIINIPHKVGAKRWESCWKETALRAQIFGVNESGSRAQRNLYRELARKAGYGYYGLWKSPNPIFWDKRTYEFVRGQVTQLHGRSSGRLARRYPGFNAPRYQTEVILKDREGQEYAFICVHWASRFHVTRRFYARARFLSARTASRTVRHHKKAGRIVGFGGDTNISGRIYNPQVTWLYSQGVDKLGVAVPRKYKLSQLRSRRFDAPTDHKHGIAGSALVTIP